jgi:membrane-bound inhibitor of C-type lysozyme
METCVANAYALRIHALREAYADARRDDHAGISLGPVTFRCEGLDALLSAVFLNGRTSLVSLQWLQREAVLPRVPPGSGAKYETDLWDDASTLLWNQGDSAIFIPPGAPNCPANESRLAG